MSIKKKRFRNKKEDIDLIEGFSIGLIFVFIFALIWGNPDKDIQVLNPKLKRLLSDDDNAKALMDAIEKEKSGEDKSPEFQMNGRKFILERTGKRNVRA